MKIKAIAHALWLEMLRRKDIYVLFMLLVSLLLVLLTMNVFGLGGISGYVKDAGLLMTWLFGWILAISVGARQLPQEETRGTIFSLLARPITRGELIAGKWLGAWSVVCAAVLTFYIAVILAVRWKGGAFDWIALLQAGMLHAVVIGVLVAIGLALSTRLNRDAAATLAYILSGAAFLILPQVPSLLAARKTVNVLSLRVLYYLLPHLELFDMRRRVVHDFGPAPWTTVFMVMLYGIAMIAIFLLLAWLGYRRKRFSRGAIE